MVATIQAASIWNIGIKTAAAQNMVALGFIEKQLGVTISWAEWFIAAAPYAVMMSFILYVVCMKMLPPETMEVAGGDETIRREREALGPMKPSEKKLMFISLGLLFLWVTEKTLHPLDTTTSTVIAVTLMPLPGIGIMNWKEAQARIS
ncbi:anion permease [uncultured Mitsuokella sp.]|uniref:SLC13 family permease n=1 Tax=uncultured Mitsuokella sp. TaxID=453120 RepID=UPI00341D5C51